MKLKQISIAAALIAATAAASAINSDADGKDLVLMSYNVRNATGMDDIRDTERTAAVIRRCAPDVVAIQELDSMTNRAGLTYVLGELAQLTGMYATYTPAIDYDGGRYGIGMLSRTEPIRVQRIALPGREEARAMLVADFDGYTYIATHLSLTREDREASLELIHQVTDTCTRPVFVAGDFNATPDSEFIGAILKDFVILTPTDAATYPADKPVETLDYIIVPRRHSDRVKTLRTQVEPDSLTSDHRPITAHIRID